MVDDIATREEAAAANAIAQRGLPVVASARGRTLIDLLHSAELHSLLGTAGCVISSCICITININIDIAPSEGGRTLIDLLHSLLHTLVCVGVLYCNDR